MSDRLPPDTASGRLSALFRRLDRLGDVMGLLDWDRAVLMPGGSGAARAGLMADLEAWRHALLTDPRVAEELAEAERQPPEDPWQAANLRAMRRLHTHAVAVPADLVAARAKATSACEMAWRGARADSDFARLQPLLGTVLDLTREMAAARATALDSTPYDALLDEYEPGGRAARLDALFDRLAGFLPDFLAAVLERQAAEAPPRRPEGPFPVARQEAVGRRLMRHVGFDFDRGRLDTSHHPFCGGATGDVRITTRYDEADFSSALMGILHETGHAMYEFGRPAAWLGQPVGQAGGMGLHESQSLIVEMQVCRSRDFLTFAAPLLREAFDGDGPAWTADNLYRLATRVGAGFIRVDADEVTYPAHVALRYRLERAMLAGDLALADLPGAWNDGMVALLGIRPPDDRLGCLQDIHWPAGAWGYFPTYSIGAMAAAQLFAAARHQDDSILPAIAKGDFTPLMTWLRTHVHSQGALMNTNELLRQTTGNNLTPEAFITHLKTRYLPTG